MNALIKDALKLNAKEQKMGIIMNIKVPASAGSTKIKFLCLSMLLLYYSYFKEELC